MNAKGFALLEWLIASALVVAIAGAVFGTVLPMRDVFERTQHRVDLVGAARGAVESMLADVREAGSGPSVDDGEGNLANVLTPLELAGPATMRLLRVPRGASQGRLSAAVAAGDTLVSLDTGTRCTLGPPACGFEVGDRAILYSGTAAEIVTIESVLPGAVGLQVPVQAGYPGKSVLCRVALTEYTLQEINGVGRIVRISDGGAMQPLLDDVVGFELALNDPDVAKARRLSLQLRVQTPAAHLRGPEGYLFARAGTATRQRQWLPDIELRAEVSFRNAVHP
jgi:hypothetical protein